MNKRNGNKACLGWAMTKVAYLGAALDSPVASVSVRAE